MAHSKHPPAGPSIVGDVSAEPVTINAKGGSLTAILKRTIRGELIPGKLSYGAKIELEPGFSCVLVAPGQIESADRPGEQRKLRVRKISNGFMISLDDGAGEVVDPTTKAVLDIYDAMLKAGNLNLLSPAEADRGFTDLLEKIETLEPAPK